MAAYPEQIAPSYVGDAAFPPRPPAEVVQLRPKSDNLAPLIREAAGFPLGAARGLVVGLALGGGLWMVIGAIVWKILH